MAAVFHLNEARGRGQKSCLSSWESHVIVTIGSEDSSEYRVTPHRDAAGCSSLHSVAVINTKTKSNLRKRGSFCLTGHSLSLRGVRAGTQDRNLKQRPRRNPVAGVLLLACSATFLRQPRPTCSEVALAIVSWALPHQLAIKKNIPQHVHRPVWWRQFCN